MSLPTSDRFTSRVADYVRYRPDYPTAAIELLAAELLLTPETLVADLGAGTGILTAQVLATGAGVIAIDPNVDMLAAAKMHVGDGLPCSFVASPAENTGLPPASVDAVVAGQAFHWFDPARARAEVMRILRPEGKVALLWNAKRFHDSPFLEGYEHLLKRHAPEFNEVRHENVQSAALRGFYGGEPEVHKFNHAQRFDWHGVRGRVMSSSYAPREGEPAHAPLIADLHELFEHHARGGMVTWPYLTEVYLGIPS